MEKKCYLISKYIYLFLMSSLIGWIYEVSAVRILYNCYYDRGVLHLPLCPLYGTGMLLLYLLLHKIKDWRILLVASGLIATAIELSASYILEYRFHLSLWTYSDWPFNYQGRISLISSIIFAIMALLVFKVIKPAADKSYQSRYARYMSWLMIAIIATCVIWELCCKYNLFDSDSIFYQYQMLFC